MAGVSYAGRAAAGQRLQQRIVLADLASTARRRRRQQWAGARGGAGRQAPPQRSAADLPVRRRAHRGDGSGERAEARKRLHAAVRGFRRVPGPRHRPRGGALPRAPAAADVQGARWTTRCTPATPGTRPGTAAASRSARARSDSSSTSSSAKTRCAPTSRYRWGSSGSLLDHTGPIAAGERNAARIFGADETLFVVGGTSTANKIVWHGTVGRGRPRAVRPQLPQVDPALADHDRRDADLPRAVAQWSGIIGPISRDQFTPESIRQKIAGKPVREGDEAARSV